MSVTNVVMLVRDRPRLTAQALESLYRHTPQDAFNLVLIDDASGAESRFLVEECCRLYSNACFLRIEKSKGITGQARNLGVYWSEKYWGRGDWLYLSDNDVWFSPGWLEKLVWAMQCDMEATEGELGILGGWNHPFLKSNGRYEYEDEVLVPGVTLHDAVTGASQLLHWDTWDCYGPHDAHAPGTEQSEDFKFCQDIIKDGGRVGCIQPHVVANCGLTKTDGRPATGADLLEQEITAWRRRFPEIVAE